MSPSLPPSLHPPVEEIPKAFSSCSVGSVQHSEVFLSFSEIITLSIVNKSKDIKYLS